MSSAKLKSKKDEQQLDRDWGLQVLYVLSCSLTAFQLFWFNRDHQLIPRLSMGLVSLAKLPRIEAAVGKGIGRFFGMSPGGGQFFARGFITKYHNQTFVGLTHILTAPIWSLLIPLQLNPGLRSNFRRLHRVLGTVFFSLSASLMVGFAAIMRKSLHLHPNAAYAKDIEGRQLRALPRVLLRIVPLSDIFLFGSAAWFSYTLVRSWSAAKRRRFAEHEEWVLRHIASGQWISLMRILQGSVTMPALIPRFGDTKMMQSTFFVLSGLISWSLCVAGAELGILRVRASHAARKARNAVRREHLQAVNDRLVGA
mmetsp:Transcript_137328/g.242705  ORF Transcript_137328/g.242705 Transcript_137328/m.242705 type:complete len:311 (-) Transcript_137328:188-1120(-)